MKRAVVLLVLLTGCAGPLRAASEPGRLRVVPLSPRCQALSDRHALWTSIAEGAGLLAGGGGVATIPIDSESKAARIGVASTAVGVGAFAAFSAKMAAASAESWSNECGK